MILCHLQIILNNELAVVFLHKGKSLVIKNDFHCVCLSICVCVCVCVCVCTNLVVSGGNKDYVHL
jgi:hypothetical protein